MKGGLKKCLASLATSQSIYPEKHLCIIKDDGCDTYEVMRVNEAMSSIELMVNRERRIVLHATHGEMRTIFEGVQFSLLDDEGKDD